MKHIRLEYRDNKIEFFTKDSNKINDYMPLFIRFTETYRGQVTTVNFMNWVKSLSEMVTLNQGLHKIYGDNYVPRIKEVKTIYSNTNTFNNNTPTLKSRFTVENWS